MKDPEMAALWKEAEEELGGKGPKKGKKGGKKGDKPEGDRKPKGDKKPKGEAKE